MISKNTPTPKSNNSIAPMNREILSECLDSTSDFESELESLSYLFRHLDGCDDLEQRLYGVGLILAQMSKRAASLHAELSRVKI